MLRVVGPSTRHILQSYSGIKAEALGDCLEAFGSEGSLGVDVDGLSFGAAFPAGHLAGDTESVAQLGLSGTKFTKLIPNTT